jgi:5-methylcytosine-specific restriction endonuclease McrA
VSKVAGRSGRPWRTVRQLVLARDHNLCQVKLTGCLTVATTVDHFPVSREACRTAGHHGGPRCRCNDPRNLRAACSHCNPALGNMTRVGRAPETFTEDW